MKVALLQYPIVWADKQANLQAAEEHIRALRGEADVALLPEMFTTGFCVDQPELAEPTEGETMRRMQSLANEVDMMIAGSFIATEGGRLYNRGFMLRPGMEPVYVDKRHLYRGGGEDQFFMPGQQQTVVEWRGARFRHLVCYDLRFPAWMRWTAENPYDILLISANWPDVRIKYWDILVPARAIENQCYIAAVNCVGDDGMGLHYNGHSIAYDTRLMPLAQWADNEEGTRIADFNIKQLQHFREVLPLYKDADRIAVEY